MPTSTDFCIVPDVGHRNQDGYIRVLNKMRKDGGRLVMLHRIEWEKINGPIPEGFEINHLCKNRECCNVNHLEALSKSEHKSKDNAVRYDDRAARIWVEHCKYPTKTQREIADTFGITQSGVHQIIGRYNND